MNYIQEGWEDEVLAATEGGGGVDICYDFAGGTLTRSLARVLAQRGVISFVAMSRFDLSPADVESLFAKNASLKGFALLPLVTPENLKADLADLFHDLLRKRRADAVDVLQRDDDALVGWNIDASDTGHAASP